MRAIQTEATEHMELKSVGFSMTASGMLLTFQVSRYKNIPIYPCLAAYAAGTLGKISEDLGPGLILKISDSADANAWVGVVVQPETQEEQKALKAQLFNNTSKDNLTLLFCSPNPYTQSILKNNLAPVIWQNPMKEKVDNGY